jgi:hypothetical protein
MTHEPRAVDFFTRLLRRPPVDEGGVHRWADVRVTHSAK